jgi:hypothetical protein
MTDGTWWLGVGVLATLAGACGGQSITFEHTDGGAGRAPEEGVGGTTGATAGTAGGGGSLANPTGGAAGLSGGAGRGGSNGFSAPEPEFNLGCDYKPIVAADCAKSGCHKGIFAAASLDLSKNDLVARLKDVPATFGEIQCSPPGEPYMECVPAACVTGALLVDSSNWEQSFMLATLRGTQNGCGETMPDDTYRAANPDKEACLEALVRAIAELPPH